MRPSSGMGHGLPGHQPGSAGRRRRADPSSGAYTISATTSRIPLGSPAASGSPWGVGLALVEPDHGVLRIRRVTARPPTSPDSRRHRRSYGSSADDRGHPHGPSISAISCRAATCETSVHRAGTCHRRPVSGRHRWSAPTRPVRSRSSSQPESSTMVLMGPHHPGPTRPVRPLSFTHRGETSELYPMWTIFRPLAGRDAGLRGAQR